MNLFKQFKKANILDSIRQIAQNNNIINKKQQQNSTQKQHKQIKKRDNWNNTNGNIVDNNKDVNKNNKKQQQSDNKRIWKISQNINTQFQYADVDVPDAMQFFTNLINHQQQHKNIQKSLLKKLKTQMFTNIDIQPIYMLDNSQPKIFQMELQYNYTDILDKSIKLIHQKQQLQSIIQKLLLVDYVRMFQIYQLQDNGIFNQILNIVKQNYCKIVSMSILAARQRKNISRFVQHINRTRVLIKKRVTIKKRIVLLNKIKQKSLRNSVASMKFENIDQAFYVERTRQKLYNKLIQSQYLMNNLKLFKDINTKIINRNKQAIQLCIRSLNKWSSQGNSNNTQKMQKMQKMQNKHIEKLLILIYFIRTQNMYVKNKLSIQFVEIRNKDKLIQGIKGVLKWKSEEFKYVNSTEIKDRVKYFIEQLIGQFGPHLSLKKRGMSLEGTIKIKQKNSIKQQQQEYNP